jgi:hypothetical protein
MGEAECVFWRVKVVLVESQARARLGDPLRQSIRMRSPSVFVPFFGPLSPPLSLPLPSISISACTL